MTLQASLFQYDNHICYCGVQYVGGTRNPRCTSCGVHMCHYGVHMCHCGVHMCHCGLHMCHYGVQYVRGTRNPRCTSCGVHMCHYGVQYVGGTRNPCCTSCGLHMYNMWEGLGTLTAPHVVCWCLVSLSANP